MTLVDRGIEFNGLQGSQTDIANSKLHFVFNKPQGPSQIWVILHKSVEIV